MISLISWIHLISTGSPEKAHITVWNVFRNALLVCTHHVLPFTRTLLALLHEGRWRSEPGPPRRRRQVLWDKGLPNDTSDTSDWSPVHSEEGSFLIPVIAIESL